ncbi:hypothetical protein A1OO_17190 [Enterovibrio norvegicus FF-33]|uniref:DUF4386 domain-containing protein n=1 Tax=Enterovibrio norvegicus FF-454 TaxID=1185651 RepID=A0A1E5BZ95_9GAMM|nr:DUF4386 family protein [Enterovibrio norvegicus]OEE58596.1 hypothetical protein A1OK_15185 [Enterovibrio norvegicus FF-454]OEE67482.1 hypothetical protein A1OO_17190 [Enterovibrio norvegicus FF-33]OEE79560.1 hypothetical protein A1OQ_00660 [Enterovibrio norvegicus FF-162]
MRNLQKLAGVSAISEAFIYILAFIYFGAFWSYPSTGSPTEKMAYLAENQQIFSIIYFLMYVIFGVFLAVLVIGLHEKLKATKDPALAIGSLFGVIWVGLVIASGMISTIGLDHAIDLMDANPQKAFDIWSIVSLITESLGGGNELVGGLWVLLLSVVALQAGEFSRNLNYLGLLVGIAGITTVYPDEIFTEIFGVAQIGWFIWLGICLLRQDNAIDR